MNVFHVLAHNDPLYPLQPGAPLVASGRGSPDHDGSRCPHRLRSIPASTADHPDLRGRIAAGARFCRDPGARRRGARHRRRRHHRRARARRRRHRHCRRRAGRETVRPSRVPAGSPISLFATCTSFTLAKALQFALDQKVQVINLSLGGPRDRLLERLLDAGSREPHHHRQCGVDPRVKRRRLSRLPSRRPGCCHAGGAEKSAGRRR